MYQQPYPQQQYQPVAFQQPYQAQQVPSQKTNIVKVMGPESAKSFQMDNDSAYALFDVNNPYFYLKTTDGAGFPATKAYRYEEVDMGSLLPGAGEAEDVSALKKQVADMSEQVKKLTDALKELM